MAGAVSLGAAVLVGVFVHYAVFMEKANALKSELLLVRFATAFHEETGISNFIRNSS